MDIIERLLGENNQLREEFNEISARYSEERKRNDELEKQLQRIAPLALEERENQLDNCRYLTLHSRLNSHGTFHMAKAMVSESLLMQAYNYPYMLEELKRELYMQYWTSLLKKAALMLEEEGDE